MQNRTDIEMKIEELDMHMEKLANDARSSKESTSLNLLLDEIEQTKDVQDTLKRLLIKDYQAKCVFCDTTHQTEYKVLAFMCADCSKKLS